MEKDKEKYFTQEGLDKLKAELEYLKTDKQKEIAQALNKAASFGDLSENAAYHQGKDDLAFLRGRVAELENIIKSAKIIESQPAQKSSEIKIGSKVQALCNGQTQALQIVGLDEADPINGKISYQSPIGKALCGKTIDQEIEVDTPSGKIKYKVVAIE